MASQIGAAVYELLSTCQPQVAFYSLSLTDGTVEREADDADPEDGKMRQMASRLL